ncbi:hypothetical protein CAEBREN_00881 [Caenorhabditis brenneri]|uniref:Uncharacterized protein n=1 Tax=Caenorhabditis brenneri TaxID=135651 RepID=G0N174_CAEBE|nr:hypothetical protein CAEBREN_00881 [Caenorhabditis brenneri]
MSYKPKKVEIPSSNPTPEKLTPAEALSISAIEEKINSMDLDTKSQLMSIKLEHQKNVGFFASHLRDIRHACLASAEPSAFQLVVDEVEANAKGLSKSEEKIQRVLSDTKEKLEATLKRMRTFRKQIQHDTISAESEVAKREELKAKKQEITEKFKEVARQGHEDAKRLKELKKLEKQEELQKAQERRQRQKDNLSFTIKKQKKVEDNLHMMKLERQKYERKQQLSRRLQSPTTATRVAAKRHYNHVFIQSPQRKPSKAFFTAKHDEEHSTHSEEEPPEKKFFEVLISPSKKLASRVMVPVKHHKT